MGGFSPHIRLTDYVNGDKPVADNIHNAVARGSERCIYSENPNKILTLPVGDESRLSF